MEVTWVLVADRSRAQLFEAVRRDERPRLLEDFDNPEGRTPTSEMLSDRPGQMINSRGAQRHAAVREDAVAESIERRFAALLAARLETGRVEHRFDNLALFCAPSFLGHVREALTKEARRRVVYSVAKDFAHEPNVEVRLFEALQAAL